MPSGRGLPELSACPPLAGRPDPVDRAFARVENGVLLAIRPACDNGHAGRLGRVGSGIVRTSFSRADVSQSVTMLRTAIDP